MQNEAEWAAREEQVLADFEDECSQVPLHPYEGFDG